MVTVVFDEQRDVVRRILESAFAGKQDVEIVQEPEDTFLHRRDLDAHLLNRPLAHYNYFNQVFLPNKQAPAEARRLVSRAPLYRTWPAHFPDFTVAPYVLAEPVFSPYLKPGELTFEDIMYLKFDKIFETIEILNASDVEPHIRRLGTYLEFVFKIADGVTEDQVERSIRGLQRAHREHQEHASQ